MKDERKLSKGHERDGLGKVKVPDVGSVEEGD